MKITKLLFIFSLLMIFLTANQNVYGGYQQDDESKSIRAREYTKKRPPAPVTSGSKPYSAGKGNGQTSAVKERYYRYIKTKKVKQNAQKPPVKTIEKASLGFTLWRLESAAEEGAKADESKGFELKQGKRLNPIRTEAQTPLKIGETARFSIESPTHNGFLYIINREQFADGTYGIAKLIFPDSDIAEGKNFIRAGDIVFIPPYPYEPFDIKSRTDRKQTAEELTIIVSPKPLNPAVNEDGTISTDLLVEWLKLWEVDVIQRELEDGIGQIMTKTEQNTGKDQSKGFEARKRLTQDDEPPQTIFDMKIKRGAPVLTRVLLEIKPD